MKKIYIQPNSVEYTVRIQSCLAYTSTGNLDNSSSNNAEVDETKRNDTENGGDGDARGNNGFGDLWGSNDSNW